MHTRKATYHLSRNLLDSTQVYFSTADPGRPGMQLVRISREKWRPTFGFRSRAPSGVTLFLVLGGRGTLGIDDQTHTLGPGQVFVLHPGRRFSARGTRRAPLDLLLFELAGSGAVSLARHQLPLEAQPYEFRSPRNVERLAQTVFESAVAGGARAHDICRALIVPLFMTVADSLSQGAEPESRAHHTYQQCRHHLDTCFQAMRSSADAAAAASISQTYLEVLFRRYAGTTPHRHLMARKVDLAAHLLRTTDEPVKVIAQQLSFSDQYVFSKAFKRMTGVSPLECRRSARWPTSQGVAARRRGSADGARP